MYYTLYIIYKGLESKDFSLCEPVPDTLCNSAGMVEIQP